MRKVPAIFSVDLIQQEDGTFKVLELNRGLDSGYEGYRMATGGTDLWKDVLKPLIFDFADDNKMHVKWYGKENMLGRSKPIRKTKDFNKLRHAVMIGDTITPDFCRVAERSNSALLDGYAVLWAAYFDKAFLAKLADHVQGLEEAMPKQKVYGHNADWDTLVERIKEDFKGTEELIFKDSSSCAGHDVYFIRMSDLLEGKETMNILLARNRFTETMPEKKSISSNSSRSQLGHQTFPHFIVQERVTAKAVPDLTRDWEAEIKAYDEKCSTPEMSVSEIGVSPHVEMKQRYRPVIRAVISAVPEESSEGTEYTFKIHGAYYKYPRYHLGQSSDFDEMFLLSDVLSARKGPQAALLEQDVQQELEKMVSNELAPAIEQVMDMSITDVIKSLFKSECKDDYVLGLNMLLDPQFFWGETAVVDQELQDLTVKVLSENEDLQIACVRYLSDDRVPASSVSEMATAIIIKKTPQLSSLTF